MKRLALGACAAALLAVSACMLPPFDVQVSRAFAAARKMEQVAAIGPLDIWRRLATGREVYFLPSRALGPPHGLLMVADSYGGSLRHMGLDPFGEPWITFEQSFVAIATGGRLGFAVHMLKDPSAAGDRFVLLAPGTDREYVRFSYDPLTGMIEQTGITSWTDLVAGAGFTGELVGVSFLPRDDPSIDEMSLLAHTGGGAHEEHELVVDEGGHGWGSSIGGGSLVLPVTGGAGFYHHDPGRERSYYSFHEDGRWVTVRWDDGSFNPLPLAMDQRVDRLLSTGDLYCHGDDGIDRVYDAGGNRKLDLAVGSLRLAYETYEGGVATLYYTLVYWDRTAHGGDDRRAYIRVYRLPTASLGVLE